MAIQGLVTVAILEANQNSGFFGIVRF